MILKLYLVIQDHHLIVFVNLRVSPGRVGPRIKISRVIVARAVGKIRVASRRCTIIPVAPPGGGEQYNLRSL